MKKSELLKKLKAAGITAADLESLEKDEEYNYECQNCRIKFKAATKKRKCPSCKANKLKLEDKQLTNIQIQATDESDHIHKIGINLNQQMAQEQGLQSGKKMARTEPVNLKKIQQIKATDLGFKLAEDIDFDKKVKYNKTPRVRKEFRLVKTKCNGNCGRVYEINPAFVRDGWVCDDCLYSKGRSG